MNFEIQIKRKKVKNITLRINSKGDISITAPYTVSDMYLQKFIKSKEEWIKKKLVQIEEKKKEAVNNNKQNEEILFLGKRYKVKIKENKNNFIEIEDGNIVININDKNCDNTKELILQSWYKEQAKSVFLNTIKTYSDILGESVNRVTIKSMKTRWGSCNYVKRYINLNLELIKQPIEFIEYVVVHELAHLVHPNHSSEFWNYVEKYMSNYKERKALVKY